MTNEQNDKTIAAFAAQLAQDAIVNQSRSVSDPLAVEVKAAARRLSTLMLGAANALIMEGYMGSVAHDKKETGSVGARLAMLNELDRLVEIVRKLDLLADKIIVRGE